MELWNSNVSYQLIANTAMTNGQMKIYEFSLEIWKGQLPKNLKVFSLLHVAFFSPMYIYSLLVNKSKL